MPFGDGDIGANHLVAQRPRQERTAGSTGRGFARARAHGADHRTVDESLRLGGSDALADLLVVTFAAYL
ncbi:MULTISPECIES: hypothetical protein [Mycobacteroides]|uniref:hypothetical protein n=1 Tax=Mycobacteroides TaxID=670516 RepID=UPI0018E2F3A4|nr:MULTISPECIES: hypothetical protein [Mycobacteroides]